MCLVVYVCLVFLVVCVPKKGWREGEGGRENEEETEMYVVVMKYNVVYTIDDTSN